MNLTPTGLNLQSPPHSASQSYTLKFPTGNVTAGTFLKVASVLLVQEQRLLVNYLLQYQQELLGKQ